MDGWVTGWLAEVTREPDGFVLGCWGVRGIHVCICLEKLCGWKEPMVDSEFPKKTDR